jgi:glycerol-3-phosphate dehydrogenase
LKLTTIRTWIAVKDQRSLCMMASLEVSEKANQASTLAALLVAAYVNHVDPNAQITIKVEDKDTEPVYRATGKEVVSGAGNIVTSLTENHTQLQAKESEVRCIGLSGAMR